MSSKRTTNNMTPRYLISFILITLVLASCGAKKGLSSKGTINESMLPKQLIRENQRQIAKFKTLQAKLKVEYINDNNSQNHNVTLRMEKDKTIWLSAPLGLARVMLTQDSARFYDKINNQYYDGDYKLISDFLGTKLDFNSIQNMLLGEAIFGYKETKYAISDDGASYILQPEPQNSLFELFYLIHPGHFKINSQQLSQPKKKRMLEVDYADYQEVDKQIFPLNLKIIAVEDTYEVSIALEYKSVTLNEEVRFPFSIPSGFKEIMIDDLPKY